MTTIAPDAPACEVEMRTAKPSAAPLVIWADTREQRIPPFPPGVEVERVTLGEGDYTTPRLIDVARIERKSISDLASSITWDRARFDRAIQRSQPLRWKCIAVEGEVSDVARVSAMSSNALIGSIASFYARWDVPTLFVGDAVGAGKLIAGLLRRWEERLAAERLTTTGVVVPAPTNPPIDEWVPVSTTTRVVVATARNPFIANLSAVGHAEAGDEWARTALVCARAARWNWERAAQLLNEAEEGARALASDIEAHRAEERAVWVAGSSNIDGTAGSR